MRGLKVVDLCCMRKALSRANRNLADTEALDGLVPNVERVRADGGIEQRYRVGSFDHYEKRFHVRLLSVATPCIEASIDRIIEVSLVLCNRDIYISVRKYGIGTCRVPVAGLQHIEMCIPELTENYCRENSKNDRLRKAVLKVNVSAGRAVAVCPLRSRKV
jgi:hypothetical protein